MKIGHISDCHLGYTSGSKTHPKTLINLREQDGYDAFYQCINEMIEQKVDLVICTGDIFHTPKPSIYTIQLAREGIEKLTDANIPFYNLAGNHDATDNLKDVPANRVLHTPKLNVFSHIEPYITYEVGENVVLHLVSHHAYAKQFDTMKKVKPIDGKFNILCTHGSCYDSEFNGILHSELSPREVIIPEEVMRLNWDYTLLGHIHERGWVSSKDKITDTSGRKQFYGGSLIRRGFADRECALERGWTLWEIKDGNMTPTFFNIPQRTQVEQYIFCDSKSISEIENEVVDFLKELNYDEIPIVRIHLLDLTIEQKMSMNWKNIVEYTSKCLSFSFNIKTREEIRVEIENHKDFNIDLISAYKDFWEQTKETIQITNPKIIKNKALEFLKEGQDLILTQSNK